MHRSGWLFILAGIITPSLAAQSSAIQSLNHEAILHPTVPLLEQRQKAFQALIQSDPDAALQAGLTIAEIDQIKRALRGAGPLLEETIAWSGELQIRIEDDFERGASRTHWRLRTPQSSFEMYFGKGVVSRGRTPGSPIFAAGIRSGDRIAVAQLSAAAPGTVRPDVTGTGTQSCSLTGPQNIAVLQLTFPDNTTYPSGFTPSFLQQNWFGTSGTSLNTYWQQTSYGKTSATGQVFGPFALSQSYTCADSDAMATAAFQAAAGTVDFTQFSRYAFVFPVPDCTYGGQGTLGCETLTTSPNRNGSMIWVPLYASYLTDYAASIVDHEHGHNLGLNHANTVDYGASPLGALDNPGVNTEYGDPYSAMASSSYYNGVNITAQYPSEQTAQLLRWLQAGDYTEVTGPGTFTVQPYENTSGQRALRIRRDAASSSWVWVEFRQSIGSADSTLGSIPGANVYNGALVHYENPYLDFAHTYLVDFNPTSSPNNFATANLLPGQTWTDPYSFLRLTVNSATSYGLSVTVNYDAPCAQISPAVASFTASGGSGSLTVTAPAGCSWGASTSTSWISLTGATSGSGNGSVPFSIASTAAASQRVGYIALNRQSIPVQQAGTASWFTQSNPSSGTGTASNTSFNFTDPKGASDISGVELQYLGGPLCQIYVEPQFHSAFLLNDVGSYSNSVQLGNQSVQSASNNECTLYGNGSLVSTFGQTLAVNLNVTFASTNVGTHTILATVTDSVGTSGPFVAGSWTVPGAAAPCAFTLTASSAPAPALGGTGSFSLLAANSSCAWTASSNQIWATITSAASGSGPATLSYSVSQNPTASPRTAILTIGGQTFTINQQAASSTPGIVSLNPTSGSGSAQIFTAVYSDTAGAGFLNRRLFLMNAGLYGSGACYVQVDPTGIYLANDAGTSPVGPLTAAGLSNNQCTLNSSGTSVVNSGNTSTVTLSLTFKPAFVGAKSIYLFSEDTLGTNTNFQLFGTYTVTSSAVPGIVSLTPSSGSGASQIFTATYSDTAGAASLKRRLFLMSPGIYGGSACYIQVDSTGIYLVNDAGTSPVGPLTAAGLSNSQCTLNNSGTGVVNSGNTSTVTLSLTFRAAFVGAKNIYLFSEDTAGSNTNFQLFGSYTVASSAAPGVVSLTPSAGSGTSQIFTATYSDTAGAASLKRRMFLMSPGIYGGSACYIQVDSTGIYLVNDGGTSPIGPLTAAGLSNSQCTLNNSGTGVVNSGNTSTVTLSLTFSAAFVGAKNIYLFSEDTAGNTNFQLFGSYTVTSSAMPGIVSLTPSTGSGATQTFTAVYSDTAGATSLKRRLFLMNAGLYGGGACYVQVDPSGIYLANDAGTSPVGPLTAAGLSNSQCTLNNAGTSVVNSGNNSTVSLSLAFNAAFVGAKTIYLFSEDTQGTNTNFQQAGSYTVTFPSVPSSVSLTPNSGSGATQVFTAVYSDSAGATSLKRRLFLMNAGLYGSGACYVQVDPTGIYLANDAGTSPVGPLTAAGLSNTQCTLNNSGTSVVNSGNTSTVTLSFSFNAPFRGVKNIYLFSEDLQGNNTGFQLFGSFTTQ